MRILNSEEIKKVKQKGEARHEADYERFCATEGADLIPFQEVYVYEEIARAQYELDIKEFFEWGDEYCVWHAKCLPNGTLQASVHKRECLDCWQSLK